MIVEPLVSVAMWFVNAVTSPGSTVTVEATAEGNAHENAHNATMRVPLIPDFPLESLLIIDFSSFRENQMRR